MTIRDETYDVERTPISASPTATPVFPSAPLETEIHTDAVAVMVGTHDEIYEDYGGNVPIVHATSVSGHPSHQILRGSTATTTTTTTTPSAPYAIVTGPPQPPAPTPYAIVTGPPQPPAPTTHGVSVVTQSPVSSPTQTTYHGNSRYRNQDGALNCCAITLIILASVCACCLCPFVVFLVVYAISAPTQYVNDFNDDLYNIVYDDKF